MSCLNPDQPYRLIIVLGMHRSGTSALASAMSALGCYAGEQLLVKNYYNQKGYWEDNQLVALNDRLLSVFGHAYDSLDLLPHDFIHHPDVAALRVEACDLLHLKLKQNSLWVFKDPRLCHLLAFWQPIFAELNIDVRYVIAFRHPLSVAASLKKRDQFSVQKSLLLWLQHNIALMTATEASVRCFVHYDDFLAQPQVVLSYLSQMLDLPDSGQGIDGYIQHFLTDTLRHSQYGLDDLLQSEYAYPALIRAYRLLLEGFTQPIRSKEPPFLEAWRQLQQQLVNDSYLLDFLQLQSDLLKSSVYEKNRVITSQLFWRSVDCAEMSHVTRLDARCQFSEQTQTVVFDFPSHMQGVLGMRFDPTDYPASICVQSLQLLGSQHQPIWLWSGSSDVFGRTSADLFWLGEQASVGRGIAVGNDPFVHLQLPEDLLAVIKPGYFFVVEMQVQPLSVYARELYQTMQEREQTLFDQQNTLNEQQAELAQVNQTLQKLQDLQADCRIEAHRAEAQLAFLWDLMAEVAP